MRSGIFATLGIILCAAAQGGVSVATGSSAVYADGPPSIFGIDAPELAAIGTLPVGVRTLTLVEPAQPDVLAIDPRTGTVPKHDRTLIVDLWYPATFAPGAPRETYSGSLPSEPPAAPATFTVPGIAARDARPMGRDYQIGRAHV